MENNDATVSWVKISDRLTDVYCDLMMMRVVMLGLLETYENECQPLISRIPKEYKDEAKVFTGLSSALYFLSDKLDDLCFPEESINPFI